MDILQILNQEMQLSGTNKRIDFYQRKDLWMISLPDHEKDYFNQIPNYEEYLYKNSVRNSSFTAFIDNKPIVCFGLVQLAPGTAEAWLIPSLELRSSVSFALPFHKATKLFFDNAFSLFQLHRIQVTIDVTNEIAKKWIETMDFVFEGTLRNFSPNQSDYLMYSRVLGDIQNGRNI